MCDNVRQKLGHTTKGTTLYKEEDCHKEFFFICQHKITGKRRSKRNSETSVNKKFLERAYNKANSSVQSVEQEAEQITMKEPAEVVKAIKMGLNPL